MYIGRFAPSPSGPLHAGSLVAALASWLDARAHGGRWLVRIEDVDSFRCDAQHARTILQQLQTHRLIADAEPVWQSQRSARYAQALQQLVEHGLAYPCACSRKDIAQALLAAGASPTRHGERVYPGTCRPDRGGLRGRPPRAWRLDVARAQAGHAPPGAASPLPVCWTDRRLGAQSQCVADAVGDFVLRRADGPWSYQLAVVVDDADQGVTDVVRGADLADNTARQIVLQQVLGLATPRYLHVPLVCDARGEKLSKHIGAPALSDGTDAQRLANLRAAAQVLELPPSASMDIDQALRSWTAAWAQRWPIA